MGQRQYKLISRRERDVIIMVGRGMPNKEIAAHLHMSISTVKQFVFTACVKLGVDNRAQAVIKAIEKGAITPQDIFSPEEIAWFVGAIDIETIKSIVPQLKQELERGVPAQQITDCRSPQHRSASAGRNRAFCSLCVLGHYQAL